MPTSRPPRPSDSRNKPPPLAADVRAPASIDPVPNTALALLTPDALARVVEAGGDALAVLDADWRYVYANDAALRLLGKPREELVVGGEITDLFPDIEETPFWDVYQKAARERALLTVEGYYEPLDTWLDVRVLPHSDLLYLHLRDVTAAKRAEERERTLEARERARLASIFEQAPAFMAVLRGPSHVFEIANPPYYQLIGHRLDIIGRPVAEALPEVVEQGFVGLLDRVYQTGEPFVGRGVPIMLQVTPDAPLEERFLDFTYQPLRDADGKVTGILAHGIDLTERRRLEQERERLLAESRAHAEREALLNRIGAAVRATDDPEKIQARAVALLGEALGLDLCHAAAFDPARDAWHVAAPDWHRPDLPSLAGDFPMRVWRALSDEVARRGATTVFRDVTAAPALSDDAKALFARMNARAYVMVPFLDATGTPVAGLAAAMSDGPRDWTPEEVGLIEAAATLVRAAVESARMQRRERNIAQQLQEALLPPLPDSVPGMALRGFYQPASDEAEVGGDFYSAYSLGGGRSALCVGDVSGKGLAAARMVSFVTTSLRYAVRLALYSGRGDAGELPATIAPAAAAAGTLARAVTDVNRVLAEDSLLTTFVTLFVGVFDAESRTLVYVSCGQEPALLWRAATGEVEQLLPTGPVLGVFGAAGFAEASVALGRGDILVALTDGITEAGPSHRQMLGIEGATALLEGAATAAASAAATAGRLQYATRGGEKVGGSDAGAGGDSVNASILAASVLSRLVAGVDAFAGGGARDDVALLVGVVKAAAEADGPR